MTTAQKLKGWDTGFIPVLTSKEGVGPHGDRGIAHVTWRDDQVGEINVGVGHHLTKGRRPGEPNYQLNVRFTNKVDDWGQRAGRGRALAFYHADFNDVDRTDDVFNGGRFTTVADELRRWENTGHGNIDGIASWDGDGRVEWVSVRVFNDREMRLYTDHFYMEAKCDIRFLRGRDTKRFKIGHCSMKFSDTKEQVAHDLDKLFTRGLDWLTGTEAGQGTKAKTVRRTLIDMAPDYGYRLWLPNHNDTWVVVAEAQ